MPVARIGTSSRPDHDYPPLLGAHVSIAGGLEHAPARGAEIGARVIQIFTKPVQRWAERDVGEETASLFRAGLEEHRIRVAGSHDSYLINLASPDPRLRARSYAAFHRELQRCRALHLDFLVTHPGNATDGERHAGIRRNAAAVARAMRDVGGETRVLFEGTAGQGTALGATFEELAELLALVGPGLQDRLGVCLDTAHLCAAGYDLVEDYDGVFEHFDRRVGLERLWLFHLNDSRTALGSRSDRHEHISRGRLGAVPFRRIMRDRRFRNVPKLIETPKGGDRLTWDRRNLRWLARAARGD